MIIFIKVLGEMFLFLKSFLLMWALLGSMGSPWVRMRWNSKLVDIKGRSSMILPLFRGAREMRQLLGYFKQFQGFWGQGCVGLPALITLLLQIAYLHAKFSIFP